MLKFGVLRVKKRGIIIRFNVEIFLNFIMKSLLRIVLFLAFNLASVYLQGQAPGWSVNPSEFEFNGSVTAVVNLGPDLVTSGTLAAFVGEECRGVIGGTLISERAVFFLMCYSDLASGETLHFRYYDPVGDEVYDVNETVPFTSNMVVGTYDLPYQMHITLNSPPVVGDIEDQTVAEGASFATINLNELVTDAESPDQDIDWTYSGQGSLDVSITNGIATIVIPDYDWNGSSTITFTATDPGLLSDSDDAIFTVTAINDPPTFSMLGDRTVNEDAGPQSLDDFATNLYDGDPELTQTLTFTVSNDNNSLFSAQPVISPDGTLSFTPAANAFGEANVSVTLNDSDGGSSSTQIFTITVNAVNDGPVVGDIPGEEINEGETFATINLDDFVDDVDDTDAEINWTASTSSVLSVTISGRVATIAVLNQEWSGTETITFTATDPDNLYDEDGATFTVIAVNDAPVVTDIPNQTIDEGAPFASIQLDNYVTDIDNAVNQMNWTVSGNSNISVTITDRVATFAKGVDWFGAETLTFRATDPGGQFDEDQVVLTVTAVNDPPSFTAGGNHTVAEDMSTQTISAWATLISAGPANESAQTLIFNVSNNNNALFTAQPAINPAGTLTYTPAMNANGVATVTVSLRDSGGTENGGDDTSDDQTFTITVTAVNDTPSFTKGADQSMPEDSGAQTVNNWATNINDGDPDLDQGLTFNVSNSNTSLFTAQPAISSSGTLTWTSAPNAFGTALVTVTLSDDGDGSNQSSAQTFNITLTPVNDLPVVGGILDQTIPEGGTFTTISLDNYVDDPDNTDAEMMWSYAGNDGLIVIIDANRIATISTPNIDWNGIRTITFRATDQSGAFGSDAAIFTVSADNDPPIVGNIPDQSIDEGETFVSIDLNTYVADPDHLDSEISWSVSGNSALSVSINSSRVATITITNPEWNGSETINFTATDPGSASNSDAATFTVTPVNDPPIVTDIPNQTIAEGATFTLINLDNYVSDVDDADNLLTWSYSENTNLSVNITNRVAAITVLNPEWNGSETITFTASDDDGASDSDPATFTVNAVNDAPVVTDIPNQSITEGSSFVTISLDNYVSDPDHTDAQMVWTYSGNSQLEVSITGNVATITVLDADWNGSETVTFRATDPGSLWDDDGATFTVTGVNDAPVITDIPDQSIAEGAAFATINLDNYVSDIDNTDADLSWTYSGNTDLSVSIEARVATITVPDADWSGSETITFTVSDGALTAADVATFSVTPVNDAPVVTDIPNQSISEGTSFTSINLDGFVSDVDNPDAQLTWTFSGNTNLSVSITDRVATITVPNADWNGSETITFRATDQGALYDTDPATFIVTGVNDAPVVSDIPDQTIAEGSTFTTITLDNYVSDIDNTDPQITWSSSGSTQLTVSIVNRIATISIPNINWSGSETITFTASDGPLTDSDPATFTVSAVNDAPVVADIPNQTIAEGSSFTTIALDNFVLDVDNADSEISWTYSGNSQLTVLISSRIATITVPTADWNGSETITFTASDGDLSDNDVATFTVTAVNDAPVVDDIPNQSIGEGGTFTTISLDNYVYDPDNADTQLTWTYSGNGELNVSISATRIATISTPNIDWNGSETITFRATDPGTLYDEDAATFTVSADNDPPIVSNIPDQTIAEGATFATISLDTYVADPDNPDSEISWTASGNSALTVAIENRVATITIPNINWNGSETITFRATDPGLLSNTDAATFTVTAVNDPPVVTDILNQSIAEGAAFTSINLDNYVSDIDDADNLLTWSYSGNTNLSVNITNRVATITALNPEWNGSETITFTANDDDGASDSDPATFTVTAVNDAPVVTDIPNQSITEGSSFVTVNLDNYVSDPDHTDAQMVWTYSGNTRLGVSITGRVATITVPDADWNGSETVLFRATDPGSLWDDDGATFTVTGVNDAPVITDIPDQTIAEGAAFATINLDNYVSDIDNPDGDLSWTYSGNPPLSVSIVSRVATITAPNADWNGAETITFTVGDPGGLSDNDAATFTITAVNDAPVVTDIPNQTITEGTTFTTINLDGYVSDPDNSDVQINWSAAGNTDLIVSIVARVATITVPNSDWNGSETITFRAADPGGLFDEDPATYTVTEVNDAPVVADIPDQIITEGSVFASITLDEFVSDIDNADRQMTWTYSGNTQLTVSIVDRVATISAPNSDWNGSETITFRATDAGGLYDEDAAIFTVTGVNDAPVVGDIPNQTITEGSLFATITLDNYVTDVDHSDNQIAWTFTGNTQLTVSIVSRIATIMIPNTDWNGAETITFTATDGGGLTGSNAATFTVTAVNDAPVVGDIPNQSVAEGSSFTTIALDNYVTDIDNIDSQIAWTYSGNTQLTVSIVNRVATITVPNADWNGSETITFRATDTGGLYDEDGATFTISADNDPPVVTDIPDQTRAEGVSFATISLDNYVSDADNTDAQITWTSSGNTQLTVSIVNRVATITLPNVNWNGSETITFTATDPEGSSNSDAATFTVTPVNDAPVVGDIPNQTIAEGGTFATIALDDFVSDVDNSDAQMTWTWTGNTNLTVSVTDRVASIMTPGPEWSGAETVTFRATDPAGLFSSNAAVFTVTAVNDPPVVTDIPDQTIEEGSSFVTIPLDIYVSDVDHTDAQMVWTYSGNSQLTVSIAARVATITIPNINWFGSETIVFTATDPGSLSDSDPAVFTVTADNDAPVVTDIPNQTIAEGASFTTIALNGYVSDVDNSDAEINWIASGNTALTVSISSGIATISVPNADWNGSEIITFTATDPGGLTDDDPVTFTVTPVNDAPVVSDIPNQTIAEGGSFATIDLNGFVSDIDNSDLQMTWTYSGNTQLTVSIVSGIATITIPNSDWNGSETVTFRATDQGGLYDTDPATFTVTGVNDAPVVSDITDQTRAEGSAFTTISLDNFVTDIDNPDNTIVWTASGSTQLTVSIVNRVATITPPNSDWNGSETITFRATDAGGLYDEDAAIFTVTGVNDAPVVGDIPNQTIAEGSLFATITLDNYVTDVDHSDNQIAWTFTGNTQLTVSIVSRIATIMIPNTDWNGAETITFTATDGGGLTGSNAATFTVTAVNDAPVVGDIPNQSVAEGSSFTTIALDNYVTDIDNIDSQIAWTYSGNTQLTVSIVNRVATITVPNADWNGSETITFRATDTGGLYDEDGATFTISADNDPPVVTDIPDQTRAEGVSFATISLDNYVSDADNTDAQITWTSSGNTQLTVSIVNRVATITLPNVNWNGSETITFTATDPEGSSNSDAATFTVTPVNDAPVVGDIPNQTIAEGGTFATIALDEYVSDVDNSDTQMTWTWTGNTNITVSVTSRIATISLSNADWTGSETITFRATDPGALFDTDPATFTVTAVNDAPVLAGIETTPLVYTENAAAVAITGTITVADVDDTNIESAVVSVSGNYQSGQDILSFTNANGITGTWNSGSGIMNLTGTASLANYQLALRNVRYFNNSENPSALSRTVSFTVNDGALTSAVVSRQINITAVNDAPVAGTVTFTGTMIPGSTLTGSYLYSDAEGDPEGTSTFRWYRADNASGTNEVAITGATARTYILVSADAGKYVSFQVTPAASSGTTPGVPVRSARQLVIKLPSGWTVNPVDFSYLGTVTASVTIDGTRQQSGFLAAFVDGECRGIAPASLYTPLNNYIYRLTCYSDNLSGDIIIFKFYDPVKDAVFEMDRSVDFVPNMSVGTSADPFRMNTGILFDMTLPSGWSWFSVNTVLDNMSLSFILPDVSGGDYIKSQVSSATYYPGYGWFGSLTTLDPTELYKIKLSNGGITSFSGRTVDPGSISIPLSAGWNWIGFMPQNSMALSAALSSLKLVNLDYIKSQASSATYYTGYGWFGSLTSMYPHQGYMIKVANSGLLNYEGGKKGGQIASRANEPQFDYHQYEFNGTMTAKVILDGVTKGTVYDSVYAFVNNEIRGVGSGEVYPPTKTFVFLLTIYSNVTKGETVSFKYYDSATKKYYPCNETVPFTSDMRVGTAPDPFELHTSTTSAVEDENIIQEPEIHIYPNPFEYNLNLDYSLFDATHVRITIFDTFGKSVRILIDEKQEPGDYSIKWDTDLPSAGTYFIKFETGRRQKILKAVLMRSK